MSSNIWSYPTGPAEFIPSALGPGAPGTETAPFLPSVSDGALHLTLQTFNPTSSPPATSFQGSAIFTNQSFNTNAGGIAFTAVAKLGTAVPGMVGGIFAYGLNSPTSHNEIDFELLTDIAAAKNDQAQTNIYANAPTNAVGNPLLVPDPSLTADHTYTIEWYPNVVLWFIDGQLVRTSTVDVPQAPMQFYLNFWAYDAGASLQPTNLQNNKIYTFDVQSVRVARIGNSPSDARHVTSFPGHAGLGATGGTLPGQTGATLLAIGFPVTSTTQIAFDLSCNSGSWQSFLTLWLVS